MYKFAAGILIGVNAANNQPVEFGALQDVSIDLSFTNKSLYGQRSFPLTVARGEGKITGKAKFANVNGLLLNTFFLNAPQTPGQMVVSYQEAHSVPSLSPYTITPVPPNSGVYSEDLGVQYATGIPFTIVASAPSKGQYSVAAGVYTFAAADEGAAILITYTYSVSATGGGQFALANPLMGVAPTFQVQFQQNYNGLTDLLTLYACVSTKLSFASKTDDFNIPEFDFEAFSNATGQVALYSPGQ